MKNLTDERLYELCKMYGTRALEWRRKFVGLLPEVERRKLYVEKGFSSIFEFAAKMAGVSREQVQAAIRVHEDFADKPLLKNLLETGEVSVNKLVRVMTVATQENQEFLAGKVKLLSNRAIETFVRDLKFAKQNFLHVQESKKQNGLFGMKNEDRSVHVNTLEKLGLSEEVVEKLVELQKKGIDINQLILGFLENRKKEIEKKKLEIEREVEGKISRYVPKKIKKVIREEYGTKCAVPNCKKSAEVMHHTVRFALAKEHNPYFIAPLCREHHEIAHAIDVKMQSKKGVTVSR